MFHLFLPYMRKKSNGRQAAPTDIPRGDLLCLLFHKVCFVRGGPRRFDGGKTTWLRISLGHPVHAHVAREIPRYTLQRSLFVLSLRSQFRLTGCPKDIHFVVLHLWNLWKGLPSYPYHALQSTLYSRIRVTQGDLQCCFAPSE